MQKNKIISILQTLNRAELLELDKFVQSPIHNKHKDVIQLFQYLKLAIVEKKLSLDKERIFQQVFPNEIFNMQKLHYVNSYLLKVVEEYLAWSAWKTDEINAKKYLMQAYRNRGVEKQFLKTYSNAIQYQEKQPLRNAHFYELSYQLQLEQYDYLLQQGRTKGFNLQKLSDTLDLSFITNKLKIACILLSHESVVKKTYDKALLSLIIQYLENSDSLSIPAVGIYYYAYRALSEIEEEKYFKQFYQLLTEHNELFTTAELRDLHILAVNYCIKTINMGNNDYLQVLFFIYKSGLKNKVFFENGIFSRWTYNNIIIAGLRLKEYEWVEVFIHEYKAFLPEKIREGNFSYNLAKYYYETNNYQESMALLLKMEYDDVLHNLGAKTLLLKMYYELEEFDALDNLLGSFKTYIYRKKVLGYHKENYLNIIAFTQKLLKLNSFDKAQKKHFEEELKDEKILTEKEWLLKQL